MKLKALLGSLVVAMLAGSHLGYALDRYYPPERIYCTADVNKLMCEGFDHQYFAEDMYSAQFKGGLGQNFGFSSAAAYFSPDKKQAGIFLTYKNSSLKIVKLKTVQNSLLPDLNASGWREVADDLYVCDAGYMSCPMVNS